MPWQIDGTFIRVNPTFSGPTTWAQDKAATIKIVATRHDVHDQDLADGIANCLNLDGYNAMRAALNMAGHAIDNLPAGVADGQPVNMAQLADTQAGIDGAQAVADTALVHADNAQDTADANAAAIAALDVRVDALEALPPGGGGTANPLVTPNFKSTGAIRHKLNDQGPGAAAIDVSAANRHFVNNNGALTITFSGLPSAVDADFVGATNTYQVEGQVIIWNGSPAGAITIAGLTGHRTIGSPVTTINVAQVLTYLISRVSGTNNVTLIWSTP